MSAIRLHEALWFMSTNATKGTFIKSRMRHWGSKVHIFGKTVKKSMCSSAYHNTANSGLDSSIFTDETYVISKWLCTCKVRLTCVDNIDLMFSIIWYRLLDCIFTVKLIHTMLGFYAYCCLEFNLHQFSVIIYVWGQLTCKSSKN